MTNKAKGLGTLVLTVIVATLMLTSVALVMAPAASGSAASVAGPNVPHAALPPPVTPTQVFYTNPTTFSAGVPTVSFAYSNVGPYTTGTTVNFWLSTTVYSTGVVGSSIGATPIEAGTNDLTNVLSLTIASGTAAGGYYILSNTVSVPTSYQLGPAINVTTLTPSFALTSPSAPGSAVGLTGSGWDPTVTVTFTIGWPNVGIPGAGGFRPPVPMANIIGTAVTDATGVFAPGSSLTLPPYMAAGNYVIVGQETSPASAPNFPITADFTLTIQAGIGTCQVGFPAFEACSGSPASAFIGEVASVSGLLHSTFTLSGSGFAAGATLSSVTVAGVATTFSPAVTDVSANGAFNVTVSLSSAIATQGPATIVVTTSPASSPSSFPDAIVVSTPGSERRCWPSTRSVAYPAAWLATP